MSTAVLQANCQQQCCKQTVNSSVASKLSTAVLQANCQQQCCKQTVNSIVASKLSTALLQANCQQHCCKQTVNSIVASKLSTAVLQANCQQQCCKQTELLSRGCRQSLELSALGRDPQLYGTNLHISTVFRYSRYPYMVGCKTRLAVC